MRYSLNSKKILSFRSEETHRVDLQPVPSPDRVGIQQEIVPPLQTSSALLPREGEPQGIKHGLNTLLTIFMFFF